MGLGLFQPRDVARLTLWTVDPMVQCKREGAYILSPPLGGGIQSHLFFWLGPGSRVKGSRVKNQGSRVKGQESNVLCKAVVSQ